MGCSSILAQAWENLFLPTGSGPVPCDFLVPEQLGLGVQLHSRLKGPCHQLECSVQELPGAPGPLSASGQWRACRLMGLAVWGEKGVGTRGPRSPAGCDQNCVAFEGVDLPGRGLDTGPRLQNAMATWLRHLGIDQEVILPLCPFPAL